MMLLNRKINIASQQNLKADFSLPRNNQVQASTKSLINNKIKKCKSFTGKLEADKYKKVLKNRHRNISNNKRNIEFQRQIMTSKVK